ncbi:flippase activity-associated protein Agl23 [Halomontanus rarus]|uniref:flippase activity-associated protein Agl23 n=1 Tax=Halomontanus rarus TaxID=3034020 RepID=UPI0023E857C0|nr:flippase activity-associated protein Agl23 [Halovivax sp. TS33]
MDRDERSAAPPPSQSSSSPPTSSRPRPRSEPSPSQSPPSSAAESAADPSAPARPQPEYRSRLRERVGEQTLPILLGITALALVLRVVRLGERVAHWDEGRVAFDTIRYAETGIWEYRPIVHGPFLPHVNDVVFSALGPTDFAMRLVVAVVGGLLPLAPWLFREHLRDLEVVAVGAFLAFNPILLYYSRFMRNDVLVATFMLFSLGTFVRFADTKRVRYLYAGFALAALGFTTKENAIVFVLCWLGAGALVLDTALFRPHARRPTRAYLRDQYDHVRERTRDLDLGRVLGYYAGHLVFAVALGALILIYFYAPRTGGTGVGFERLASRPDLFPAVADQAFADFWEGITDWGDKSADDEGYDSVIDRLQDYVGRFGRALAAYAPALSVFAVAGIVGERYLADRPRSIVLFFGYWGLVSVPGYALGMDIWATWALVHALVPLAFPAGVALAWVLERGLESIDDVRDGRRSRSADAVLSVAIAAILLVSMLAIAGGTAFDPGNTRESGEDHIVQYAQPNQDVRETLADVESVVEATDDPVLYFAEEYAIDNESAAYRPPVADRWTENEDGHRERLEDNGNWYRRLPLPWYMERAGAERLSAHDEDELDELLRTESPAVVITHEEHDGVNNEELVDRRAGEYVKVVHEMRSPGDETVFYVRTDALEALDSDSDSDSPS